VLLKLDALDLAQRVLHRLEQAQPVFGRHHADLPRTSSGSPVMSRRRRSAALIAGCDWFSLTAARVTLRSINKVCKTRKRYVSIASRC
jgi:hypothetical protein